MKTSKPSFAEIPPQVLMELASLLSRSRNKKGEKPYGFMGWRHTVDGPRKYRDSAMRHLLALMDGKSYDEDGNHHAVALMANAMILADLDTRKAPGEDDSEATDCEHPRPTYGATGTAE